VSISQRINAERIVLFGWSRAILLQLAHPLVAAGVADHSSIRQGALTAALRLHHTVRAMTRLTFGSPREHADTIAGILAIHRRVRGHLRQAVGPWGAGTPYSAEDPALVLWVHATLLESLPMVYEQLVAPLSAADRDAYCREAAVVARELGADADVPETWHDLESYVARMHASGRLVVGEDARALAEAVLAPPFGPLVAPARHANRVITTALLPESLRVQYGLPWGQAEVRACRRWVRTLRAGRAMTPRWLREWPEARRAAYDWP
jgi:uncharacterized protein (DUF2236 family)